MAPSSRGRGQTLGLGQLDAAPQPCTLLKPLLRGFPLHPQAKPGVAGTPPRPAPGCGPVEMSLVASRVPPMQRPPHSSFQQAGPSPHADQPASLLRPLILHAIGQVPLHCLAHLGRVVGLGSSAPGRHPTTADMMSQDLNISNFTRPRGTGCRGGSDRRGATRARLAPRQVLPLRSRLCTPPCQAGPFPRVTSIGNLPTPTEVPSSLPPPPCQPHASPRHSFHEPLTKSLPQPTLPLHRDPISHPHP